MLPITSELPQVFPKEKGREIVLKAISDANEVAFNSKEPHVLLDGPMGVEKVLVSRIAVGNEYLGSVYAFCYIEKEVPAAERAAARARGDGGRVRRGVRSPLAAAAARRAASRD